MIVAIIGNIVGIGGGVMLLPFFIFYLHLNSIAASGLSLFTIVISTIGGTFAFIRQKTINYKLFTTIISLIIPGVIIGSIANKFVNTQEFKEILPLWVITIGIFSLVTAKKHPLKNMKDSENDSIKHSKLTKIVSFISGFVSGFFGVGIGGVMGTYLVAVEQISARIAFSTLVMVMTITSLFGFFVHFESAGLNLSSWIAYLIPLTLGAIFGSQIGAYISKTSNTKTLRLYQGYVILSLGISLLIVNFLNLIKI
ncbi:sulfite exporter TauE/SafE family protein [Thermodesulfobium narugense]|nr:sulfite exporter TauE/SafE family protein [Thermodesulfobium narugense]